MAGITHEWQGTTLIITSDSGTTGMDLAGPEGQIGVRGPQGPAGLNGSMKFADLTEEERASLKGDKGDTGEQGIPGPAGPQGPAGPAGAAFKIVKIYNSVAEMNADYAGTDVAVGEFVIIQSDTNDVDNAKVYLKSDTEYSFIVDLSGSQGIQGPEGPQGIQGIQGETGAAGKTPVKGTDYFTAAEQASMISSVKSGIFTFNSSTGRLDISV